MMILLCLLGALAQDPTPTAPTTAAPTEPQATEVKAREWQTVDRIVMVVNQDIITELQLVREMQRLMRRRKITSDTDKRTAEMEILMDLVRKRLGVQAGSLLGIDEKLIDARVADSMEQMRKRSGGVVGLVNFLKAQDIEGPDVRRLLRDDIYESIFTEGVTGEAPGPLGRVTADRYVRPGLLKLQYEQALDRPLEVQELGGSVGLVKFQQIVLDVAQNGGGRATRELASDLIARVQAGEDMGILARQYGGAREDDGIAEVEEPRLKELFPEIAAFTSQAKEGAISAPIETSLQGRAALRILRFLERKPAVVPSFEAHTVQSKLRDRAQRRLEHYRLELSYGAMLASSYVWPPELRGRER